MTAIKLYSALSQAIALVKGTTISFKTDHTSDIVDILVCGEVIERWSFNTVEHFSEAFLGKVKEIRELLN
jgi:hypothetical protein